MIIDTIKLIASELADMSPKTQLEIVKLCKNMCLAVKDYLVENDEKIEDINTYIENLQTAVSNLNGAIAELTSELATAESNITANANAILTIQDSITALQTAISNVYTKTEIDTMLASIYTKSEVNTLLLDYYKKVETYSKTEIDTMLSLYYTMIQVNELLNGKLNASDVCFLTIENRYTPVSVDDFNKMYASKLGVIFYNGYTYFHTQTSVVDNVITLLFYSPIIELGAQKIISLPSDTRLISPIESQGAQEVLVSGTNIKTINGNSLLGSGDLVVGGDKLYVHNVLLQKNSANIDISLTLITKDNTAFDLTSLITYLYTKLPDKNMSCSGRCNGTGAVNACNRIKANTSTSIRFWTLDQQTLTIQNTDAYLLVTDNVYEL